MLADGNGTFSKSLGLEMDGTRSALACAASASPSTPKMAWSRSCNIEAPGEFKVSDAKTMLEAIS